MRNIDWKKVEEPQEYKRMVSGGYICKITTVTDVPDKEYLKIEYDIASGDFKDYYKDLNEAKKFWGGNFIRSYSEKAESFFRGFLTALENSNPGFIFDNDITKFVGKNIGLVLGEEEYIKKDETLSTRLYVYQVRSIIRIKENDFVVPKFKKLKVDPSEKAAFEKLLASGSEELPF